MVVPFERLQEFMVQSRGISKKFFGRNWGASGVGGKALGVWEVILMRFFPQLKEQGVATLPLR